eukprot:219-Rhodomonas_salina.1
MFSFSEDATAAEGSALCSMSAVSSCARSEPGMVSGCAGRGAGTWDVSGWLCGVSVVTLLGDGLRGALVWCEGKLLDRHLMRRCVSLLLLIAEGFRGEKEARCIDGYREQTSQTKQTLGGRRERRQTLSICYRPWLQAEHRSSGAKGDSPPASRQTCCFFTSVSSKSSRRVPVSLRLAKAFHIISQISTPTPNFQPKKFKFQLSATDTTPVAWNDNSTSCSAVTTLVKLIRGEMNGICGFCGVGWQRASQREHPHPPTRPRRDARN